MDHTKRLYALNPSQHAAVLAALRGYQNELERLGEPPSNLADIATNGGELDPLSADDIDTLCEGLNHEGLDIGAVVNILGVPEGDPYVKVARQRTDEVTVDPNAIVSRSDDGAYVMGWVWINKDET